LTTQKSLGKHKNIVQYYNSCIGKLVGGGYEILILMEYCGGRTKKNVRRQINWQPNGRPAGSLGCIIVNRFSHS
jgi:hypothetical protein